MILLGTKVISEPLRARPESRVVEWLDAQPLETVFVAVITVAELRCGVALLPNGRRRNHLRERLETQVLPAFAGRMLAFALPATQAGPCRHTLS
jgi:predicted nucleic acid-binding protein